jgi:transmembrane sensor
MDKQLLQKYFRNQCTLDEIEMVLEWFQTKAGEAYLEERLDRDLELYADEENLLLHPDIPSEDVLIKIEKARNTRTLRSNARDHWWMRVAMVLLICGVIAGGSYWFLGGAHILNEQEQVPDAVYRTISTLEDQQRHLTLGDGTQIRLNSNSSIVIPERFAADSRYVSLSGEAWFKVEKDEDRPFSIEAEQAVIRVLGTAFNVKVDTLLREVQVAVSEGSVSLSGRADVNGNEVFLTENTFALYHLENEEILIERSPVDNYLSWISGNLSFYDEPLWVVSRYLERIYGVPFRFEEEYLKNFSLSIEIQKRDLVPIIDIITQTLGISYHQTNDTVIWMERI